MVSDSRSIFLDSKVQSYMQNVNITWRYAVPTAAGRAVGGRFALNSQNIVSAERSVKQTLRTRNSTRF